MVRRAWLHAGLPQPHRRDRRSTRSAAPAQQAAHLVNDMIKAGTINVGIACGVESMSRIPLGANVPPGAGDPRPESWNIDMPNQFEGADRIARNRGLGREDLEAFGLRVAAEGARSPSTRAGSSARSRRRGAGHRQGDGKPTGETRVVSSDEGLRDTTMEGLAGLKPCSPDGLHTAGTSSQISDGASAVLLMDSDVARVARADPARPDRGPRAWSASDPYYHLDGPIDATRRLLERTGMTLDDFDIFEVNEAFASVVLSWAQQTGADLEQDQRQRRRDRAGPPRRLDRHPPDHHRTARARATRRDPRADLACAPAARWRPERSSNGSRSGP